MDANGESIFGTRPWKVFGEGPASAGAELSAQGFNEGKGKSFTAEDVRFTRKGDALYAIVLGSPTNAVRIKSLGTAAKLLERPVDTIALLGSRAPIRWSQAAEALIIEPPPSGPSDHTMVFRITVKD